MFLFVLLDIIFLHYLYFVEVFMLFIGNLDFLFFDFITPNFCFICNDFSVLKISYNFSYITLLTIKPTIIFDNKLTKNKYTYTEYSVNHSFVTDVDNIKWYNTYCNFKTAQDRNGTKITTLVNNI